MKKIVIQILCLLILAGCSVKQPVSDDQPLSILCPSGAPALAFADLMTQSSQYQINIVDGADVLQAAFVQPDGSYDVIVAPTNLGVKLAQANKTEYRLAAVITWGNLYVLAENEAVLDKEDLVFAGFGEQSVPGLVFEQVKQQLGISEVTYYSAVAEAQAALLSKNADAALIAEPAATATIAKAKEKGINLAIVADIQSLWSIKGESSGFPQASIFVKETESNTAEIDEMLMEISKYIEKTQQDFEEGRFDQIASGIDAAGCETLGLPGSSVTAKSFGRMGLNYRSADECEAELRDFLALFNIDYQPENCLR